MLQQGPLARRSDAADFVQRVLDHLLLAPCPMRTDLQAGSLVTQAVNEVENRVAPRQCEALTTGRKEAFAAGGAVDTLGDTDGDDTDVDPHFLEHRTGCK